MINSFEIKNYRNLNGLQIKSFGRINLIAGKNNTGKTNFLHALELLVSEFDIETLKKQFEKKREYDERKYRNDEENHEIKNILIFKNLYPYKSDVILGESIVLRSNVKTISAKTIKIKRVEDEDSLRYVTSDKLAFEDEINSQTGFEILRDNRERVRLLPFDRNIFRSNIYLSNSLKNQVSLVNYQFIETDSIEKDLNSNLWDRIALSNKEVYLIDALKIIDASIERLTFVGDTVRERYAIVKKNDNDRIFPLKSMGDGINRILTIILALLNVEQGYLFIDEFENGLHYTVQEDLWEIIFQLAEQLNIQVFATTHSSDCINAFQKILNNPTNTVSGQYIRLENKNDEIREIPYTEDEIKYASENDIEVR